MSDLTYRKLESGDESQLLQVLGEPDSVFAERFRRELRSDSDEPWLRSVVALYQGVPVGAGMVYTNKIHPDRYPAYVEVASTHRREGIGGELLSRLREYAADGPQGSLPLIAKIAEGTDATAFSVQHGFGTIQTSWLYELRPGALPTPTLKEGEGAQLEEAILGSVELSSLIQRFYEFVHQDWSPAKLSVGNAQAMFLSESSGALGGLVLRDQPRETGGTIQAFAISYRRPEDQNAADLFVGYDPQLSEAQAEEALESLLALASYKEPVEIEIDSSMRPLRALADRLDAQGALVPVEATCLIIADDQAAEH